MSEKLAYRIDEAAAYIGLGRSTLYELIRTGEIELGKLAGRSVILRAQLDAYVARNYRKAG